MNIHLKLGQFKPKEAIQIVTEIIHLNIKHQEGLLKYQRRASDIARIESIIKGLKKSLYEFKRHIEAKGKDFNLNSLIEMKWEQ
jgi:hypothetical protein